MAEDKDNGEENNISREEDGTKEVCFFPIFHWQAVNVFIL